MISFTCLTVIETPLFKSSLESSWSGAFALALLPHSDDIPHPLFDFCFRGICFDSTHMNTFRMTRSQLFTGSRLVGEFQGMRAVGQLPVHAVPVPGFWLGRRTRLFREYDAEHPTVVIRKTKHMHRVIEGPRGDGKCKSRIAGQKRDRPRCGEAIEQYSPKRLAI